MRVILVSVKRRHDEKSLQLAVNREPQRRWGLMMRSISRAFVGQPPHRSVGVFSVDP